MKKIALALLTALTFVTPVFAQNSTIAPGDLPALQFAKVSSSTFVAAPLQVLLCDATSNDITVTLPDATSLPAGKGLVVSMIKTGSSHYVAFATVDTPGTSTAQTINTLSASTFNSSYKISNTATSLSFVSDGANWYAVAGGL
jgi:hypothetical protein